LSWLRRLAGRDAPVEEPTTPPEAPGPVDVGDSPEALRAAIADVVRLVNASAGDLPTAAVVNARAVTDVLTEIVDTSRTRPLDVYTVIAVRATLTDYLPTTLRSYLAIEPELRGTPRAASGHTATQSLLIQLDVLLASATATLAAARDQDVDALMTQGGFLRTKFSRSDLDL
jgi:hypothetical protein